MSVTNLNAGGYKQINASGNVSALPVTMLGIFVSTATTSPTITVYDDAGTGTSTKIVNTFTPSAATWYFLPASASKGLYVALGGSVECTVVFA